MKWEDRHKAVNREEALEALLDGISKNVHVQLLKAFASSRSIPLSIQKPESSLPDPASIAQSEDEYQTAYEYCDSDEEEEFEDSDDFEDSVFLDDYYDYYC